jgi:thiosulfate/3-mercaptopyruvate sulfurtransferase
MTSATAEALVSSEWLAAHLSDENLRILDCTWHHTSTKLDGRTQYRGRHLPGAVHFDIDSVADPANPLPHMLPSAADFAKKVGLLGVGDGDRVIVYDRQFGGSAAARAWWIFRVFGYRNVSLLDGGFTKWTKEKLPTEMSPVRPTAKTFTATWSPALVRTLVQMRDNLESGAEQVVDARGPAKYDGTQEDVFKFKKQGHMPNAINVPWADLLVPSDDPAGRATGIFEPVDVIKSRFEGAGIDPAKPIVATCASGILSPMVALALHLAGNEAVAVYDGGWCEWSLVDDAPVVMAA